MTRSFEVDPYLELLGCSRPKSPSALALAVLQTRHLCTVPFENLDIHVGRPLSLDEGALFDKLVRNRRGGFCYELNGLFARLLRELEYDVTLLSCRTYDKEGRLGPEHDHLALYVRCEGRWLVDVGFGDAFPTPLDLDSEEPQLRRRKTYRVVTANERMNYAERKNDGSWTEQYAFTFAPQTLRAFDEMCLHHQRSPQSSFTQKRVCTRLTEDGQITLAEKVLIRTRRGERAESPIKDEHAWRTALRCHFSIELESPSRTEGESHEVRSRQLQFESQESQSKFGP